MKDKLIREIMPNLRNIDKSKKYLVALSGGADSSVLLHSLTALNFNIIAVHVHHNVREESDGELEFCKNLANSLYIPFYSTKLEFADGEQMNQKAYRDKRYAFIKEIYQKVGASGVFLGQHLDDQIENAVVSFFKRKSVLSLKAMKTKSELMGMTLYRPLLNVRKHEILEMAQRHSIQYVTDKSNFEECYERNKVRLSFIPMAEKIFGKGIFKTLEQLITSAQAQDKSNKFYTERLIEKYGKEDRVSLEALKEHSMQVFIYAVHTMLKNKGHSVDYSSFNDLENLLIQNKTGYVALKGCSISVVKGFVVIKEDDVRKLPFTNKSIK